MVLNDQDGPRRSKTVKNGEKGLNSSKMVHTIKNTIK